jgi:hypothetical protein
MYTYSKHWEESHTESSMSSRSPQVRGAAEKSILPVDFSNLIPNFLQGAMQTRPASFCKFCSGWFIASKLSAEKSRQFREIVLAVANMESHPIVPPGGRQRKVSGQA